MKLYLLALLGGVASLSAQAAGLDLTPKNPPVRSTDAPALVWDLAPDVAPTGYRNFRTTSEPLKAKSGAALPDLTGFAALHESGSSEFTTAGFKKMAARFTGPVVDFDLRQEDHGYLNGQPVSWYATNNWGNVGKTHDAIVAEERGKLDAFSAGSTVVVTDDSVKKADAGDAAPRTSVKVAAAQSERQVVEAAGAHYVRLTVTDHARPTDAEVDRFVAAVRDLPPDAWAHFHCRAGRGRTTTFMALYDMLRNAPQVSLAAIIERQSLAAGDYDLLGKEKEGGAKEGVAADRANFVRAFYRYAQANPNGKPQLWTEWLANP